MGFAYRSNKNGTGIVIYNKRFYAISFKFVTYPLS